MLLQLHALHNMLSTPGVSCSLIFGTELIQKQTDDLFLSITYPKHKTPTPTPKSNNARTVTSLRHPNVEAAQHAHGSMIVTKKTATRKFEPTMHPTQEAQNVPSMKCGKDKNRPLPQLHATAMEHPPNGQKRHCHNGGGCDTARDGDSDPPNGQKRRRRPGFWGQEQSWRAGSGNAKTGQLRKPLTEF